MTSPFATRGPRAGSNGDSRPAPSERTNKRWTQSCPRARKRPLTLERQANSATRDRFGRVSAEDVDTYLRGVEEPKRSTLQALRRTILEIVPDAEEVISYGVPAFRSRGETVAGFAAFKSHLSYLPFSGSVLGQLQPDLEGYTTT